jgi:hypothetical protein
MLCPPVGAVKRTVKPAKKLSGYINLTNVAKEQMQQAVDSKNSEMFTRAIKTLVLIGQDDVSVGLWQVAANKTVIDSSTARAALPALYRQQDNDGFLWAFSLLEKPTQIERDMLWQLIGTQQDAPLQVLIDNLRKPYELDDLLLIADRISKTRGPAAVLHIIDDTLRTAKGRNMRGLKRLRKVYGG